MRPQITARYMGLKLNSPLIVGACPLTLSCEAVRELVVAGAGAVVLPSLFEEQIVHQRMAAGRNTTAAERTAEANAYHHGEDQYNGGPLQYLRSIEGLKRITSVPIIASLDGFTGGRWLSFARDIESSGADALELNLHTDFSDPSRSADQVEEALLECVCTVRDEVSLPLSIKLLPFFTSLPNLAWRLTESGADGLVVFGREPDWVVLPDELRPTTRWSLTPAGCIGSTISGLLRVRCGGPGISVAASGGISSPADLAHVAIAGADVAMVTSEVQREGPDAINHMVEGLISFLERHQFESFECLLKARPNLDLAVSRRLNYLQPLSQTASYRDPTPTTTAKTGDRWGHLTGDPHRP